MAIQRDIFVLNQIFKIKMIGSRTGGSVPDTMKRLQSPSRYAVRAIIAGLLRQGDASLPRAAGQLKISARSLQRHLAVMGISYSELFAEVRLDAACHLLAKSDERICDIAARLGFADASSFSRTFMRLMKLQPRAYRRQQMVAAQNPCRNRWPGRSRAC
jgi:AraC-like DNA-binding protein